MCGSLPPLTANWKPLNLQSPSWHATCFTKTMAQQEIIMTAIPDQTGDLVFAAEDFFNDGGDPVGRLPEELTPDPLPPA